MSLLSRITFGRIVEPGQGSGETVVVVREVEGSVDSDDISGSVSSEELSASIDADQISSSLDIELQVVSIIDTIEVSVDLELPCDE